MRTLIRLLLYSGLESVTTSFKAGLPLLPHPVTVLADRNCQQCLSCIRMSVILGESNIRRSVVVRKKPLTLARGKEWRGARRDNRRQIRMTTLGKSHDYVTKTTTEDESCVCVCVEDEWRWWTVEWSHVERERSGDKFATVRRTKTNRDGSGIYSKMCADCSSRTWIELQHLTDLTDLWMIGRWWWWRQWRWPSSEFWLHVFGQEVNPNKNAHTTFRNKNSLPADRRCAGWKVAWASGCELKSLLTVGEENE